MRFVAVTGVLAAMVGGCDEPSSDDVVGPFTGPIHRFVVDRFELPRDGDAAAALAGDLDGDGLVENTFGYATAVLATTEDLSPHAPDMIASGALASYVELQADDLVDDPTVGIRYVGGGSLDDAATVLGGQLRGGAASPASARARSERRRTISVSILGEGENPSPLGEAFRRPEGPEPCDVGDVAPCCRSFERTVGRRSCESSRPVAFAGGGHQSRSNA